MVEFDFLGTVTCNRCGATRNESIDECQECAKTSSKRFRFRNIMTEEVVTVWSISQRRAWYALKSQVDNLHEWVSVETGWTTLHVRQRGEDVMA